MPYKKHCAVEKNNLVTTCREKHFYCAEVPPPPFKLNWWFLKDVKKNAWFKVVKLSYRIKLVDSKLSGIVFLRRHRIFVNVFLLKRSISKHILKTLIPYIYI